ncbi:hypothetical protein VTK73DRAFT_4073 [Phialemonium thermophilum]|uniref:Uncharacterized protein n=1 Tax=Phialemonium thermophilum TaxID=223376 RepID=A0ABR3VC59_9PEZI
MPSTLPPSSTGVTSASATHQAVDGTPQPPIAGDSNKPKYVISSSGHAAHPDDIIASCRALQAHIAKLQADAEAELKALEERIRERDLAEKRRVAPGWLDSDARLLEPERKSAPLGGGSGTMAGSGSASAATAAADGLEVVEGSGAPGGYAHGQVSEMAVPDEGEQLDRAFGLLALGSK